MNKVKNRRDGRKKFLSFLLMLSLVLTSFLPALQHDSAVFSYADTQEQTVKFEKYADDQWKQLEENEWEINGESSDSYKIRAVMPEDMKTGYDIKIIALQANQAGEEVLEQVSYDRENMTLEFRALKNGDATVSVHNSGGTDTVASVKIKVRGLEDKVSKVTFQRFKHGDGGAIHPTWRDVGENGIKLDKFEEIKKGTNYAIRAVAYGKQVTPKLEILEGKDLIEEVSIQEAMGSEARTQLEKYDNGSEFGFRVLKSGKVKIQATAEDVTEVTEFDVVAPQPQEDKAVIYWQKVDKLVTERKFNAESSEASESGVELSKGDVIFVKFCGKKDEDKAALAGESLRSLNITHTFTDPDAASSTDVVKIEKGHVGKYPKSYIFKITALKSGNAELNFQCDVKGVKYSVNLPVKVKGEAGGSTSTPGQNTGEPGEPGNNQGTAPAAEPGASLTGLKFHKKGSTSGYYNDFSGDEVDLIIGQGLYLKPELSAGKAEVSPKAGSEEAITVEIFNKNNQNKGAFVVNAKKIGDYYLEIKAGNNVLKTIKIKAKTEKPVVKFSRWQWANFSGSDPGWQLAYQGERISDGQSFTMRIGDWYGLIPEIRSVHEALNYTYEVQNPDLFEEKTPSGDDGRDKYQLSLKAVKAGESTVKVKSVAGESTVTIKVESKEATSIRIINAPATMGEGTSVKLLTEVTPSDTTDKVKWSIDRNDIAEIGGDGTFTAKKAGTVKVTAKAGAQVATAVIEIKNNAAPKIYFKGQDGKKVYVENGIISLNVTDSGTFHMDGEENNTVAVKKWDAEEKVLGGNSYFWFWIDRTNRFHPRKQGEKEVTVSYIADQKDYKTTFTLKVVPSGIEEIRAYTIHNNKREELNNENSFSVQGSQRVWLEVEGRLKGSTEFKKLPDTAYALKYKYNQHIIGNSFALWAPGTHIVEIAMLDDNEVKTSFKTNSVYVKGEGIGGEIPKRWPIHDWNDMGKKFVGMRSYSPEEEVTKDWGHTMHTLPRNASYHDLRWESHDPEIAEFDPLHSNGLVPKKPGKARFTISLPDNPAVKKDVEVEFYYKNPLTVAKVKPEDEKIVMAVGEVKELNLLIEPQYASEQRFNWKYEGDGQVGVRDKVCIDPTDVNVEKWTVHTLRAIKPGKVTVTGVPYDETGDLQKKTVKFTVEVKAANNDIKDLNEIVGTLKAKKDKIEAKYASLENTEDLWIIAELGKLSNTNKLSNFGFIERNLIENGKLTKDVKVLSKAILALRASGIDPEKYYGYNLVDSLIKMKDDAEKQGLYTYCAYIWAISSDNYGVPTIKEERQQAVRKLLDMQSANGLWENEGQWQDATGFALYALAPYFDNQEVKQAVEKAVNAISAEQNQNADIADNSNSLSMVVGGLCSCDIAYMTDNRLVKNGKTLLHALNDYNEADTDDFVWKKGIPEGKPLATEQAFRALISYFNGYVFDFADLPKSGLGIAEVESLQAKIFLNGQIERAKDILKNSAEYKQDSIAELKDAVKKAKELLDKTTTDKVELDKMSAEIIALLKKFEKIQNPQSKPDENISVSFTLKGMEKGGNTEEIWIAKKEYKIPKNSVVKYVFEKALNEHGIEFRNTGNYIPEAVAISMSNTGLSPTILDISCFFSAI